MAYMRGEFYIYEDGHTMNFLCGGSDLRLPMDVCEEFVAMKFARMIEEGTAGEAIRRAADKYNGNFGADAVSKLVGLPVTMDWVEQFVEDRRRTVVPPDDDG